MAAIQYHGLLSVTMTDEEIFDELWRRLRECEDPDVVYAEGSFILHRWDGRTQEPPLLLYVNTAEISAAARIDEETHNALWPDTPLEHAGLNLFLANVDEVIRTRSHSGRRHIFVSPHPVAVADSGPLHAYTPLNDAHFPD